MWAVPSCFAAEPTAAPAVPHHALAATLDLEAHSVQVEDAITLPADTRRWVFALHRGLAPAVDTKGWKLVPADVPADVGEAEVEREWFAIESRRRHPRGPVVLRYGGVFDVPPTQVATEYQRSFATTPGVISTDGVYLSGSSWWVPTPPSPPTDSDLLTFELSVRGLPDGWEAVSQGERTARDGSASSWRSDATEAVHLVAGPWTEYDRVHARADGTTVDVRAYLRTPEPALASRYLSATGRYLDLYEDMLPRYPYPSFALVENFWDTGYGMPGFTLLGPQVIRFPFILTSSYPHELLHNWWGNGAYFAGGNWCEGLTSYLADHLFAEQRGEGVSYRRGALQRFTDYVDADSDFPLVEFGERSSAATEAVGYGKSLMLFHMARRAVGDEAFLRGLSAFFDAHRFSRGTFAEIGDALGAASGEDLRPLFDAWTTRKGAPVLVLDDVKVEPAGAAFTVTVGVAQQGVDRPFPMDVPVAVTVEGEREPRWVSVVFGDEARATGALTVDHRPLRVDVDPRVDVMRRLDPLEIAPSVSTALGGDAPTFVLPARASAAEQDAWKTLAAAWAEPAQPKFVSDDADALPSGTVWVLGWDNALAPAVSALLAADGVALDARSVTIGGKSVPRSGHSAVLVGRSPTDPAAAVGWVGTDALDALPGLARKVPHYGRYAGLVFDGSEPTNSAKVAFEPRSSPLVRGLADGPLPPLVLPKATPIAELPSRFAASSLLGAATELASPELAGRGLGTPGLASAGDRVVARAADAGVELERRSFRWTGGEPARELDLTNLVATFPGSDPALEPVLVTAHLDHLGTGWPDVHEGDAGKVHPGADDNASGVAVLLELARAMAEDGPRARTVILAVTTGEEAGLVGARHLLAEGPRPFACLNLDTVGRRGAAPIQVVGADSATEFRFAFQGIGFTTGIATTLVPIPLASSDHTACHELGVPAVQLTTGPNADYHRPTDTPDHLDGEGLVAVTDVAWEALQWLGDRVDPLTVTLAGAAPGAAAGGARKVSLGTVPDFTFAGPGVRVQDVLPSSPAAAAGLRAGDVVVAIGDARIADLKALSEALKAHAAGDRVAVEVLRDGKTVRVQAVLAAR